MKSSHSQASFREEQKIVSVSASGVLTKKTPSVAPPENKQQGKAMKTRPAEEQKGNARSQDTAPEIWFRLLEHFSVEVSYCRGNPVPLL